MDFNNFKTLLKSREYSNFLIFTGDECAVQKIYIEQLSKISKLEVKCIDAVTDIMPSLRNKNIISKSYLYVVRDDKELITNEKLQNRVESMLGQNILIILLTKLDKRMKFYNKYKDVIVEFDEIPEQILEKYIDKQIELSNLNRRKLTEVCEHNYGRILLEIDKIKNYVDGCVREYGKPCNVNFDEVFQNLLHRGIIYTPPADAIFDLVESILRRDRVNSFRLLKESYANGEATLVMLTVLFNTVKAVLQVQECKSKEVSKSTGLSGWQIMNANKLKGYYKSKKLEDILCLIQKIEIGIKTGKIEDRFAMEYLLCEIL